MKLTILITVLSFVSVWMIDWDTLYKECRFTYWNVCATEKANEELQRAIEMQRKKEIEISNQLYWQDMFYR